MLKLVGYGKDGAIADEKTLVDADGKPTLFLCGLAVLELVCDIGLACILAKTVFNKR